MEVTFIFTNGLMTQTRMHWDASVGGLMKNKIAAEIRDLINNMSKNEYMSQDNDRNVAKRKDVLKLKNHDALLASQKLLGEKI